MSIVDDLLDTISDSWERLSSQGLVAQDRVLGWILGALAVIVVSTIVAWQVMVPLLLLVVAVILYLRRSRDTDSL